MNMSMLWDGWSPIVHTTLMIVVGYVALMLLLRTVGPRSMSKMTPLDFVLAVTIGSAFGRTITASEVSLSQAVAALVVLIALKWALAMARSRFDWVRSITDHAAVVIYEHGKPRQHALRRHRLVEADLHEAARANGLGSLEQVDTIVLLRAGGLAVIRKGAFGDGSSLSAFAGCRDR